MSLPQSFPLLGGSLGSNIPTRGLGTFQADPKVYPVGSVKASTLEALRIGYRHFDAALGYNFGQVEREVGEALRESGIPRDELFVTTKLHNTFHAPQDVEVGLDMSLKNLGLEYVDLYLMHFPYAYVCGENYSTVRRPDGSGKPLMDYPLSRDYFSTWRAMEALLPTGKTKAIGVSNFNILKLKRLMSAASIAPAANQVEFNPYFPQPELINFCKENSIQVIAHSPLGGAPIAVLATRKGPGPLDDPLIKAVASSYQKTPAQVIMAWIIGMGACVIPKSNNPRRIAENFDVLFQLKNEEIVAISKLMGDNAENAVRNIGVKDYIGFDIYDEAADQPVEDDL